MIISFEQTPEDFYRLSLAALEKGELEKALNYCEKAINGKGSNEYKMTLADIFLRMGRYFDAMDVAIEVLCAGGEEKGDAYDVLSRATGATGKVYESIYYITKKARLEGDEAALDAMDEMMEEMSSFMESSAPQDRFFVVGQEPKKDYAAQLDRAVQLMHTGAYEKALALASEVEESSSYYADARDIALKCYVKMGDTDSALCTAKEQVARDPKDAFALYVLVGICKKREYLSLLEEADGEASDLYYAVAAANAEKEYPLAEKLAARLLAKARYSPEAYFVAAGVAHNARDHKKRDALLKDLFSLYKKYPANLILDGLKKKRSYDVMFGGLMPETILSVLRDYVRKHAHTSDAFLRSMLTDGEFRRALLLLFQADDEEVVGNAVSFYGQEDHRELDRFFDGLLLRPSVSPMTKREILAERLLKKHKGGLTVVPTTIPMRVSCKKPEHYELYPDKLQDAYVDALSFGVCVMDLKLTKELSSYMEKCFRAFSVIRRYSEAELTVALICLIMPDPGVPFPEDMCAYVTSQIFGLGKRAALRVRRLMEVIKALD